MQFVNIPVLGNILSEGTDVIGNKFLCHITQKWMIRGPPNIGQWKVLLNHGIGLYCGRWVDSVGSVWQFIIKVLPQRVSVGSFRLLNFDKRNEIFRWTSPQFFCYPLLSILLLTQILVYCSVHNCPVVSK